MEFLLNVCSVEMPRTSLEMNCQSLGNYRVAVANVGSIPVDDEFLAQIFDISPVCRALETFAYLSDVFDDTCHAFNYGLR